MEVIIGIIIFAVVVYLYYLLIKWFFTSAAGIILILGSAAYIVLILVNYFRAVFDCVTGTLPASISNKPIPPEPAYKNYFFRKAYLDYADIVVKAFDYIFGQSKELFQLNTALLANEAWFLTWPLALTFYGVFLIAAVAGVIAFLIFGIIHLLAVSTACSLVYIVALYLRTIEWISMAWRSISYRCPHAECYKPITLPEYICPKCGAVHKKLIPGAYGLFRRRCQCGYSKLPTSVLIGRRKLEAQCPHCHRPLNKAIGSAASIHIPIIGGASAGKTNFLMSSVVCIEEDSRKHGRIMTFPEDKDKRIFDANKASFKAGQPVQKTAALSPEAFLLRIKEPSGKDNLVFIYDAAGELYGNSGDTLRRQKYFSYIDGLLFLIDPFSVRQVQVNYSKAIRENEVSIKPSPEFPQDVYDRMTVTFRDFSGGNFSFARTPIMVMVTKIDAFDLLKQIGINESDFGLENFNEKVSPLVREWLIKNGEGNLVRCIENDFKNVRYSCCSALGQMPLPGKPFKPYGVLQPIHWLLKLRAVKIAGAAEKGISWKNEKIAYAAAVVISTILFFSGFYGVHSTASKIIPENMFANSFESVAKFAGHCAWQVGLTNKDPYKPVEQIAPVQEQTTYYPIGQNGRLTTQSTIRSGPSKIYSALTVLGKGTVIYVQGRDKSSGWFLINYNYRGRNYSGYVSDRLVKL